jgi:hypothetical protein
VEQDSWGALAARVRLSKSKYYLIDNLHCHRLSELGRAVKAKMRSRSRVRREQKLTERVGSVHRDPVVEEGAGRHRISLDSSAT